MSREEVPDWELRAVYLCMEQSGAGTAAQAHLRGFFGGPETERFAVVRARHKGADSAWAKATHIMFAIVRFWIASLRADVVGARAHPLVIVALAPCMVMRKRCFLFLQGRPDDLDARGTAGAMLRALSQFSFRHAIRHSALVLATSPGLEAWARNITSGAVVAVRNGVDLDRFDLSRRRNLTAAFVGTPARWQGLDTLVEAVGHPNWPRRCDVVVIGVERSAVTGGATPSHLRFVGKRSPAEVADLLTQCAIGLSPKSLGPATSFGVSPFKLAEYHGAGLAIVASDVPGQREILLASRAGVLCPPDDPSELAKAVANLVDDPSALRRMQLNARVFASENLSWTVQRARLRAAVLALCSGNPVVAGPAETQ